MPSGLAARPPGLDTESFSSRWTLPILSRSLLDAFSIRRCKHRAAKSAITAFGGVFSCELKIPATQ